MSFFQKHKPFIIAGPCSAETEEQVLQTALQIKESNAPIHTFRAGIWKPRTRPNSFEGKGKEALSWLIEVKEETGFSVSTEVANAAHVEASLKAGIDILWIGARSTVSPFIVQEIADALKGVDIPIMIKNPVNPDLSLWLGAIERVEQAGIKNIAAIHRGFSTYYKTIYRNVPNWEIPIELKRLRPDVPIFCDPSHIGGKRDLIEPIAQQAMNLQFDGLMIESHPQPEMAWSDAAQQITPTRLAEILKHLQANLLDINASKEIDFEALQNYRKEIDRIDAYILELLAERMNISEEIGKYKQEKNIAIHQPQRWAFTVDRAIEIGKSNGLSEEFIVSLFQSVHKESIDRQSKQN